MNILVQWLDRIDATVATTNPFTAGSIAGAIAFLLAAIFLAYSVSQVLAFKPPSSSLDEERLNRELLHILRTSHANPPMSLPAAKGLGFTKDDRVVDESV